MIKTIKPKSSKQAPTKEQAELAIVAWAGIILIITLSLCVLSITLF